MARVLGLRTLNLTGGEPLLDKKYFSIAEYANRRNISMLLFTNGMLITRKVAQRLMDLKISPCVKLDSLSSATQDYLASKKGTLEKIRNGIRNLMDVGYTTTYPVLSVNAVISQQNLNEIPELWVWARKHNIVPSLTRLQPMGRAKGRTDLMVAPKEIYELYGKISEIDKGLGITWEPTIPWVYGKACKRHYIGCFIDSRGNVQPCSGVPIKAGNIRERGLGEILSSARIFEVARNIENYIEGACKSCKYKSECYGCRSIAYCTSGSFTAADPLCWYNRGEAG
jgi:radical SAM protein with 4Fe4S-binding SPASM domain